MSGWLGAKMSSLFNSSSSSRDSDAHERSSGSTSRPSYSYSRDFKHERPSVGTGSSISGKKRSRSQQRRSTTPKRSESPPTPSPLELAVPLIPEVPEVPRSIEEVQGWKESPPPDSKRKATEERSPAKRSRKESGRVHTHELWALPPQSASSDTHSATPSRLPLETRLRDRLHHRESSKARLKNEKEILTTQVQELSDRVRGAEEREKYWEEHCKTLERDLKRSEDQHQRVKQDFDAMLAGSRAAAAHVRELETKNARQDARLKETLEQLQRSKAKLAETVTLLDVRSAELKGAQVFLSKADLYAGGEIIQMINGLNEEIFQCCANIAEAVVSEEEKFMEEETTLASYREGVSSIIGPRMVALLDASRLASNGDPLPLQTALQILLVDYCRDILTAFDLDSNEVNKKLALVYESAFLNEEQAVAGRWRSLTMTHLRPLHQSEKRAPVLARRVVHTLILGGYSKQSPSYRSFVASLKSGDNSRLAPIEKGVWALRQAIGEGVTSCDIMAVTYWGGQPFDAEMMEDMYPDEDEEDSARQRRARKRGSLGNGNQTPSPSDEKAKGLPILGTVQLGLHKTMSTRSDGRMVRQKEVLLRPKVILARTLEDEAGR